MTATWHFLHTLPAAASLLPARLDTIGARAMLLAIALQESKFRNRVQVLEGGRRGPAHGYWQAEVGGSVTGVLTHPATRRHFERVLSELGYVPAASAVWTAIEHHDVLACVHARLNLLWLPDRLPRPNQADEGWRQYLAAWRPGQPRAADWPANYSSAWAIVTEED